MACLQDNKIMTIVAMATMPERLHILEKTVSSLRPQVDVIRVYLNNFERVPSFLSSNEGLLSKDALGDMGDARKFFWFDKNNYDHYLTVDDDMFYPENYAETLIHEFERRQKRAIVGVHGFVFSQPIESYVTSRSKNYKGTWALDSACPVHVIGTATAILSPQTIKLNIENFQIRNMADLQLAIVAQKQKVPMVVVARNEKWISELQDATPRNGYSIWKETKRNNGRVQADIANKEVSKWQLFPDPLKI